jgi:hypothetical protein
MKAHSEKQNPASKPSTKSMLRAGLDRAGRPDHADAPINGNNEYVPSNKFQQQSASLQRRGETRYADYPDKPMPSSHESTGNNWAGSKRGSR